MLTNPEFTADFVNTVCTCMNILTIVSLCLTSFKSQLFGGLSFPSLYYLPLLLSSQKPGMDLADTYIMFVRQNQDILREKVNEEMYIEKLFDVSN